MGGLDVKKAEFSLSEIYHRAISSSLSVVEENLSEIEDIIDKRNEFIFKEIIGYLDNETYQRVKEEIKKMRYILSELKKFFNLDSRILNVKSVIFTRGVAICEVLCELTTEQLSKHYGEAPPGLSEYLDCRIHNLIDNVERINKLVNRKD